MSPLCSLNVNRLLPLPPLLLLPTRAWVLSVPFAQPAPVRRTASTAFRFTFYCQCAHMVSSLCSRLYCHYHHHVAINTPSHIHNTTLLPCSAPLRYAVRVTSIYHSARFNIWEPLEEWLGVGCWTRNCFGMWQRRRRRTRVSAYT